MCYCGKTEQYEKCCESYILNKDFPKTAEQLMRSRYSAYVIGSIDYIMETTSAKLKETLNKTDLINWATDSDWLKLRVLNSTETHVEFIAYYKQQGSLYRHHEYSSFANVDKRWYYDEGNIIASGNYLINECLRNDVCTCGSLLKFKKCCSIYL